MFINFNHLKTFFSALVNKMKGFRGNWNQNDPTADDYIKNRPFYAEIKEVFVLTDTEIDMSKATAQTQYSLIEGQTYIITWDGVEYESVARNYDGYLMLGNNSIYQYDDGDKTNTREPFALEAHGDDKLVYFYTDTPGRFHTVNIRTCIETIHKIDTKFIDTSAFVPDDIATTDMVLLKSDIQRIDKSYYSYEWDGVPTDDYIKFNAFKYYKISNYVVPYEFVKSCSSKSNHSKLNVNNDLWDDDGEGRCYRMGGCIVITKPGICYLRVKAESTAQQFVADSVGVYAFYRDNDGAYYYKTQTVFNTDDIFPVGSTLVSTSNDPNGKPAGWKHAYVPTKTSDLINNSGFVTIDQVNEYIPEPIQPDLAQNDETAPDYVKNRTHYEETTVVNEPLNITWDGNTEGLVSVEGGAPFYKVSDAVLTDEQIKLATIVVGGEQISIASMWDDLPSEYITDEIVSPCDLVMFVRKDGAIFNEMLTFPECGIYFVNTEGIYPTSLTTTEPVPQTKTVVKKLDKKFLPETTGGVQTVNGVAPDANGNVEVSVSGGGLEIIPVSVGDDGVLCTCNYTSQQIFEKIEAGENIAVRDDMNYRIMFPYEYSFSRGNYVIRFNHISVSGDYLCESRVSFENDKIRYHWLEYSGLTERT